MPAQRYAGPARLSLAHITLALSRRQPDRLLLGNNLLPFWYCSAVWAFNVLRVVFAKSSLHGHFLAFCLMSGENYRFRVIHRFTQNNFIPSQSQLSFNNAISPLKIRGCSLTGLSYS